MKRRKVRLTIFFLVAVVQLLVPLYMIWHWEDILVNGRQYRWATAPVDPYDALRGRYVELRFKENKGPVLGGATLRSRQKAFAVIDADANGYARIRGVSPERPVGDEYVAVRVNYVQGNIAQVTLPFRRFYMREELAPAAEQAYGKSAGKDAAVTVRLKDGLGVVEQLYIGEQTINDYLRAGGKR